MRVKRYDWVPEGTRPREPIAFIFTFPQNRDLVMDEVVRLAPDYPVYVRAIGSSMYGYQARSLEIRHAFLRDGRERSWWEYTQCRLVPESRH